MSTNENPSSAVTASAANSRRPMTGDEYLESLRDGREVWLNGERVKDVTLHPAFRNSARSIARLYDALWDEANADVLRTPTTTGNGGFTHPFFRPARSVDDMLADQKAIAHWARMMHGFMGRTPDYKAGLYGGMEINADFFAPFEDNARAWHRLMQERIPYVAHAIVNPPVDRNLPADEVGDVFIHVENETDNGLVVSGAKVVATNVPLTNYCFVGYVGAPLKKREFAVVFTVPMDAPGVKVIARASYEQAAAMHGSPFDYPLASRLDENDAIFILDHAVIPWENVLVYGDTEKAGQWAGGNSGQANRIWFHGATRLAVKIDLIAGLMLKAVRINGTDNFRGVQARVGEIIGYRNLFWSLSSAMARNPNPWLDGHVLPDFEASVAYRIFSSQAMPQIRNLVESSLGSALIYLNGHAKDFKTPELRPLLDRYLRGSNGNTAIDRVKTLKMLWEIVGSEFAGRNELYERSYTGSEEDARVQTIWMAEATGLADSLNGYAESAMAEYDLDGWKIPDFTNPDDVARLARDND
ncbi:pyoverdin chromophore biosynthetic protein pvcC [Acrocarpospora corrugata]|uniref:Pyoverdin chromophore biosynthetic protein pvcC n=1 Tax=Acrocarpospora corrugata TaxID=35763 RepID=A0A5M3W9I0_9ACTN|nr:4-hydroxyphenylacetate 3-hydroxylase N-terminal domain-containing protein [Acrocarpospora corrugata]GES03158.1 pyoverdin chromophore biosynthetic protein pvcC [Acrocarpospora corrugata]